jgi:hypothetical protein
MEGSLDRPATLRGNRRGGAAAESDHRRDRAAAEGRPVRKSSTEVLALPVMPLCRRDAGLAFCFFRFHGPDAVVLQFVDPAKPVWLRASDRQPIGCVRKGDRSEKPPRSRRGDHGRVWGLVEDE